MKTLSEQQVLYKLSSLCSASEHCSYEMTEKMRRWEVAEDIQERVLRRLREEKFVDDERFCKAFVHDKIRYGKWGRRKIEQALYAKRIPREVSRPVLDEVGDEEYLEVLRPLLESKRKSVKAASDYELRGKLTRFALGRGFLPEQIDAALDD